MLVAHNHLQTASQLAPNKSFSKCASSTQCLIVGISFNELPWNSPYERYAYQFVTVYKNQMISQIHQKREEDSNVQFSNLTTRN